MFICVIASKNISFELYGEFNFVESVTGIWFATSVCFIRHFKKLFVYFIFTLTIGSLENGILLEHVSSEMAIVTILLPAMEKQIVF